MTKLSEDEEYMKHLYNKLKVINSLSNEAIELDKKGNYKNSILNYKKARDLLLKMKESFQKEREKLQEEYKELEGSSNNLKKKFQSKEKKQIIKLKENNMNNLKECLELINTYNLKYRGRLEILEGFVNQNYQFYNDETEKENLLNPLHSTSSNLSRNRSKGNLLKIDLPEFKLMNIPENLENDPDPRSKDHRPYWLMRVLSKSMMEGGYLTSKMYIPKHFWQQGGCKIPAMNLKIENSFWLNDLLNTLSTVDISDIKLLTEKLDEFINVTLGKFYFIHFIILYISLIIYSDFI